MLRRPIFVAILLLGPAASIAQTTPDLSVERIFGTDEFASDRFGPARWLDDGSGYTLLEEGPGGASIVRYDPESGRSDVLVSASELTPTGANRSLSVADYVWSADGGKLLIFTNTRRVWRYNTRGDYWVLDRKTGALEQIGRIFPATTLMFATFSPQGDRVAYVSEHNLYVERLADHSVIALTRDGTDTLINGTFDWVYEEEFDDRNGFRWSPDGTRIAYWQLDAAAVGEFLLVNNTDSLYSFTIPLQYPKTGTDNSTIRIGVVSADGGETVWVRDDHYPQEHYMPRMDWADDSDELLIQHMDRLQQVNTVLLADADTGTTRTVFVDRDDAWLDAVDDLLWLDDGRTFTWVSEQSGYRHVHLADRATGRLTDVTDGDYDIVSVARIDTKGGWLYFIGSLDLASERYLYRVPLRGGSAPQRLSPVSQPGWHEYQISEDARWAIHTYESADRVPTIDLVSLPDHRVVRTLVDNVRLQATVDALELGRTEFFQIETADQVTLDGWMIKPTHFDESLRYPVFFHVYGEPWDQTVLNRWGGTAQLWHHMIAEKGYVVISIDNRGTPGPRNRAWRKSIYGEIGTLASHDQAAALDVIATWPWVDDTRVGIWGWSGGGSMTLNMLFRHPEKYHVGMSVAPVPDQTLYDTIYQERYMGLPQSNPDGYRGGSPITYAAGLQGKLLLVHGTGDDNVHYQGSERLINRLIAEEKQFEMFAYPNRSHGIHEGPGTTVHLRNLLTRFLLENLRAGGDAR